METMQLGIYPLPYPLLLHRKLLDAHIYSDMRKNYYWSDDFSPAYYIAQAKAGFIAITDTYEERELLLPEIQFSYALLDFSDLHISRKVKKLLNEKSLQLIKSDTLERVAHAIGTTHKNSWLTPRYLAMLNATKGADENFHVTSFFIEEKGKAVAGEIGYSIGDTYTSLSGFTCRERSYNHYGTAQLVLLANYLEQQGYAFWNLGQPYMEYKFALGAKVYERSDFLKRWFHETRKRSIFQTDKSIPENVR